MFDPENLIAYCAQLTKLGKNGINSNFSKESGYLTSDFI